MNLHTCPHCQTPALYALGLQTEANCHSCGAGFTLTRFTKTEKNRITRWVEVARLKAESARRSRRLLYSFSMILLLLLAWFGASLFGLVPDEWRLINRRFASVEDEHARSQAVGLVAMGDRRPDGSMEFTAYFTATAITNDGFMLTAAQVSKDPLGRRIWVFVDGRRLDAEPVGADSIADIGVIKVDEELRYRFRLAGRGAVGRLNVEVNSIGYPAGNEGGTSPAKQTFGVSHGTISRVFSDPIGTEWIEHNAPISGSGVGGPLILDDTIVGLNLMSKDTIMRSLSTAPLRTRILRMIDRWKTDRSRD